MTSERGYHAIWRAVAPFRDAGLQHVILSPFDGVSPERQPDDRDAVARLRERFMHEVIPALRT